jgi:multidrug efflux pump subunit AcrA (membrane-fusion protein)
VGQPLLKFAYVNFLRLKANVPSGLVANLEKGMIVSAKINSQDETKAKVSQIYPVADPIKHTVVVKFDLPLNTIASPGMYAEVMIPIDNGADEEKKMIVIPVTALLKGRSLSSVLLVKGDTSELRLLRLGAMQGKDKVEVVSGLSSNDRIIDKPKIGAVSGWMPK